jgi:DNA damage-binding protein 1
VVTCSGAFKDGSLRVVRNGIGIHEHAIQPCQGIKGIWSLNPPPERSEKYLIMAFVGEVCRTVVEMEG